MTDQQDRVEEVRALRLREREQRQGEVDRWLAALPRGGAELGVSRSYLLRLAGELILTPEELDGIFAIREEHQAKVPNILALIARGHTTEEVNAYYAAVRTAAETLPEDAYAPAIEHVIRFTEAFPSAAPDAEELGEQVVEAYLAVREVLPGVRTVALALRLLCEIAETYRLSDVHTAIAAMWERRRVEKNIPAPEDDEPAARADLAADEEA